MHPQGIEPTISVIITAYNRKEYLRQAVDSALNQTLNKEHYEIIVTKNFDTEYDDKWKRSGVLLIRFDGANLCSRIVHASKYCSGEVICILNDDDYWEPTRLDRVMRAFRKDPNVVYYHNDIINIYPDCAAAYHNPVKDYEWKRVFPWHNDSSVAVKKSLLIKYENWLLQALMSFDMFCYYMARVSGGEMVFDDVCSTYYRVPQEPRDRGDVDRCARNAIMKFLVSSKDKQALRHFNLYVLGRQKYWDWVSDLNKGKRPKIRSFLGYTYYCIRLRPPFSGRRWLLMALGLLRPQLAKHFFEK